MNKRQILLWASKAGSWPELSETPDKDIAFLWKFASLVAEHEREQCALEADRQMEDEPYGHAAFRCANIAHAIRERSNQQSK